LAHSGSPPPLAPPQAINNKSDRLLALQDNAERNPQAIARLKTICSLVAAGVAFLAAALKDWLFGGR